MMAECPNCEAFHAIAGAYPPFCEECGRNVPTTASTGTYPARDVLAVGYQVTSKDLLYYTEYGAPIYVWHYRASMEQGANDHDDE
jgi:uncharacterized protein (DUF983 family)